MACVPSVTPRRSTLVRPWLLALAAALLLRAIPAWSQEDSEYRLGREDQIRIQVWNRADLTGLASIDAEGRILVPLLVDPVRAEGLTPAELSDELTRQYRLALGSGLPKVTVTVAEYRSRRINVIGEVRIPGPRGFRSIPSITDVILEAGGWTPSADLSSVQIIRKEPQEGEPRTLTVDLSSMLDGTMPDSLLDSLPALRPLDTVSIPSLTTENVATGSTFQVLGAVKTPGIYRISTAETLAEALAISGGPLPEANLRKVHLTRTTPTGLVAYKLDLEGLLYEGRTVSDFHLKEGDTVSIPSKSFGPGTVARGLVLFLPLITSLTSLIVVLDR